MRELRYWRGMPVPFITCWDHEVQGARTGGGRGGAPTRLTGIVGSSVMRVSYQDEVPHDRDRHGVLWQRYPLALGKGHPHFARVHPARQRRCMDRMLCQVCGNPANVTDQGTMFLVTYRDAQGIREQGQRGVRTSNPPVCQRCADLARSLCPNLLKGNALISAATVTDWGVYGIHVDADGDHHSPDRAYTHPAIMQMLAGQRIIVLSQLTLID